MTSIVHDIVVKAWKPHKSVSLKKLDKNTFLFVVSHETDLKLALDKRPWSIRGAHLGIKTWNPVLTRQEVDFSSSTFWIQIHGLLALWYVKVNIMKIGNKVGRVIDEDFLGDPPLPWQHFTRIRTEVDFAAPLLPGLFLPRNGLTDVWIALKYERHPKLCYNCRILGHDRKASRLARVLQSNKFGCKFPAFGDWVRSENDSLPPDIYEKQPVVDSMANMARTVPLELSSNPVVPRADAQRNKNS